MSLFQRVRFYCTPTNLIFHHGGGVEFAAIGQSDHDGWLQEERIASLPVVIYTGVKAVDVQEVKGLPEGLGKGGEGGGLEVLELGDEASVTSLPASL